MIGKIVGGVGLVLASFILAMGTLALWLRNIEPSPTTAWLIFAGGFALVAGMALWGIWTLINAVKIDRDEVDKS